MLEVVAPELLQPGRDAAVFRQHGILVGRCGFQAPFQQLQLPRCPGNLGEGLEQLLAHRSPVVRRLLRQVPDTASPRSGDDSGRRIFDAGDHLQQRRLPAPVPPDQTDLLTPVQLEAHPIQQQLDIEALADIVYI